jgi:hypothetical protein
MLPLPPYPLHALRTDSLALRLGPPGEKISQINACCLRIALRCLRIALRGDLPAAVHVSGEVPARVCASARTPLPLTVLTPYGSPYLSLKREFQRERSVRRSPTVESPSRERSSPCSLCADVTYLGPCSLRGARRRRAGRQEHGQEAASGDGPVHVPCRVAVRGNHFSLVMYFKFK